MRSIFKRSVRPGIALSAVVFAMGNGVAAPAEGDPSLRASGLTSRAAPAVSAEALARAQTKFARALAIVDQFNAQAQAAGISGDAWRFEMLSNLMKGSEENFAIVGLANSYHDAMRASLQVAKMPAAASNAMSNDDVSAQSVAPKSLGQTTTDLVYVPITPCRIVDTRAGGAAVAAGTVSNYFLLAANVGAGSCSVLNQIPVPGPPAAFAANVTVDETGLTGFVAGAYLQAYPQGGSTTTSFMNFGPNQIIANAGIISLSEATGEFSVVTSAPAQVIVDAYGVFIAPQPTALSCTLQYNSQALASGFAGYSYITATCPANTTPVAPYCNSPRQSGVYSSGSGVQGATGFCAWINSSGVAITVYQGLTCCQIPGRTLPF
jgi:hypothetical protein